MLLDSAIDFPSFYVLGGTVVFQGSCVFMVIFVNNWERLYGRSGEGLLIICHF